MNARRVLAGLALAAAVLALFVWTFGVDAALAALRSADPVTYAVAPMASLGGLVLSASALAVLCRRVDGAPRGTAFAGGYATGLLLRSLAPWGRSGGSLLTAAALDRRGTCRFEDAIAACVAAAFLGTVGSTSVALVGAGVLLAAGSASAVTTAALVAAATVAALGLAVWAVVARPGVVVTLAGGVVTALRWTVGRVWGRADRLLARANAVERAAGFLATVRGLARDPLTVGPALALTQLAALTGVVALWASLGAVGEPVSFPVLMVVVPLTTVAAIAPLPGGTGGVEFALAGVLVAGPGVSAGGAAAAVLLYRLATYWLGLIAAGVGAVVFRGAATR